MQVNGQDYPYIQANGAKFYLLTVRELGVTLQLAASSTCEASNGLKCFLAHAHVWQPAYMKVLSNGRMQCCYTATVHNQRKLFKRHTWKHFACQCALRCCADRLSAHSNRLHHLWRECGLSKWATHAENTTCPDIAICNQQHWQTTAWILWRTVSSTCSQHRYQAASQLSCCAFNASYMQSTPCLKNVHQHSCKNSDAVISRVSYDQLATCIQ